MHAQSEHHADHLHVAVGRLDFVEDPVVAQQGAGGGVVPVQPGPADRCGGQGGASGDEEVQVGGVRPAPGAVGEVNGQAYTDRCPETDRAAGHVQAVRLEVAGVVQGEVADFGGAQGVEGEQGGDGGPGRVRFTDLQTTALTSNDHTRASWTDYVENAAPARTGLLALGHPRPDLPEHRQPAGTVTSTDPLDEGRGPVREFAGRQDGQAGDVRGLTALQRAVRQRPADREVSDQGRGQGVRDYDAGVVAAVLAGVARCFGRSAGVVTAIT